MYRPSSRTWPPVACQATEGRTLSPADVRPTGVKAKVSPCTSQIAGGWRLSDARGRGAIGEGSEGACDWSLQAASSSALAPQRRARMGITHPPPRFGRGLRAKDG